MHVKWIHIGKNSTQNISMIRVKKSIQEVTKYLISTLIEYCKTGSNKSVCTYTSRNKIRRICLQQELIERYLSGQVMRWCCCGICYKRSQSNEKIRKSFYPQSGIGVRLREAMTVDLVGPGNNL